MNGRSKRTGEETRDGPDSDRQLLARFVDHDDEDAFARLVSRYCGLVMGVCRRTLGDEHSAEDAFQATFLVLARRASQIRARASLAGWLYAVAHRTARRAGAKRHRRREEALRDDMTATDDILAQVITRHEQQLLDEEISRLPPKYREPLVFRYLLGKSNREIAGELGVSLGVVEGRLKRAKDRLRLRLVRRGISVSAVLAAVGARVWSIEIVPALATRADSTLSELGYEVSVLCGDGYRGWPEHAPFDAVVVTAAPEHVPQPLVDQLAVGGRLVIPVGDFFQELIVMTKLRDGTTTTDTLFPVRFVPMTGEAEDK